MTRKSVFAPPASKKTILQIKVDEGLKSRIAELKSALEQIDEELQFDVSAICQNALELAVRAGEKEIEEMKGGSAQIQTARPISSVSKSGT